VLQSIILKSGRKLLALSAIISVMYTDERDFSVASCYVSAWCTGRWTIVHSLTTAACFADQRSMINALFCGSRRTVGGGRTAVAVSLQLKPHKNSISDYVHYDLLK